jgi:hypothetical protein
MLAQSLVIYEIGGKIVIDQASKLAGKYRQWFDHAIVGIVICIAIPTTVYYYFPNGPVGINQESERYRKLAEYVKRSTTIDDAVLASDIGYVGYYSGRKILDSWGLVWKEALVFDGTIAERVPQIARQFMPKAVVVPARGPDVRAIKSDEWFRRNYKLSRAFFEQDVDLSQIRLDSVPEAWSSQYLVYVLKESSSAPGDSLDNSER